MAGGIDAWRGQVATTPIRQDVLQLSGEEAPEELLAVALALEDGAATFYLQLARAARSDAVREVATRLARAEERHGEQIRALCAEHCTTPLPASPVPPVPPGAMEGGADAASLLQRNPQLAGEVEALADLAMALEVDALDLYLRMARQLAGSPLEESLQLLAEQEKGHLRQLASLLGAAAATPASPSPEPSR